MHHARRPASYIGAAGVLASGHAFDARELLLRAYERFLNVPIALILVVDSKHFHRILTSQSQHLDKSIWADVVDTRYEFETQAVSIFTWIPGKLYIADVGAKFDRPLNFAVSVMLKSSPSPFHFGH